MANIQFDLNDPIDKIRKMYYDAFKNITPIINNSTFRNFSDDGEEPEFSPIEKANELHETYNLPLEIKILLSYPQTSNQMIKFKEFTFYNMNQILGNINHYMVRYEHNRFLDLGHQYHGMGHYVVLAWDKQQKKFFFRLDGGANGFDQMDREQFFFTKFNPEEDKYQNRMLDWNTALNLITTNEIMNFDHVVFAQ